MGGGCDNTSCGRLEALEALVNKESHSVDLRNVELHYALDTVVSSISEQSRRSKNLSDDFSKHMANEEIQAKTDAEVRLHMNDKVNDISADVKALIASFEHLATKEDVAKTNGRVNTIWIIGSAVVLAMLSIIGYFAIYMKDDLSMYLKKAKTEVHRPDKKDEFLDDDKG